MTVTTDPGRPELPGKVTVKTSVAETSGPNGAVPVVMAEADPGGLGDPPGMVTVTTEPGVMVPVPSDSVRVTTV